MHRHQPTVTGGVSALLAGTKNLPLDTAKEQTSPERIGEEIIHHASIHLTLNLLQSIIANQVEFDSAAAPTTPAANGKNIWEVIKEFASHDENWLTSDSYILKIRGKEKLSPQNDELVYTVAITRTTRSINDDDSFEAEIINIANPVNDDYAPDATVTPLRLKKIDDSLKVVTEYGPISDRLLRDYQADACIQFAQSLKTGLVQRLGLLGPGSGKGSILTKVAEWLQYTAGKHGNFVCVLPTKQLATDFKNDDVRNSDSKLHQSVRISSEMSKSEWKKTCKNSGNFLVLDRSDSTYRKKLKYALKKSIIVMVDEAHQIIDMHEWKTIMEAPLVFAVTGTPSRLLIEDVFKHRPVVNFSTYEAIKRRMIRNVQVADLGNVPNERLFLDAYHCYIGMTAVNIDNNTRSSAIAQKSLIVCLDTPEAAQKICRQLIEFSSSDSEQTPEIIKLQFDLLQAKKLVDEKAISAINSLNVAPEVKFEKKTAWRLENPDRSYTTRNFADDIQCAQQQQLAATINALALHALFPIPNKGFEAYQEQLVTRNIKTTLTTKQKEAAAFFEWENETDESKKDQQRKANPCIKKLSEVTNLSVQEIAKKIHDIVDSSLLTPEQKRLLVVNSSSAALRIIDAIKNNGDISAALFPSESIDLELFGAKYADVVYETMNDDEANRKLALLNYGFVMNLISQGLHSQQLKFSTGTSIPSVLGLMMIVGPHSDIFYFPTIASQIAGRNIRGPLGEAFTVISQRPYGNRPPIKLSDLTPLQQDVVGILLHAFKESDEAAARKSTMIDRRSMFSETHIRRRLAESAPAQTEETKPTPTQLLIKQKTEEFILRTKAKTSSSVLQVAAAQEQLEHERTQLRESQHVATGISMFDSNRIVIDVESDYEDEADERSDETTNQLLSMLEPNRPK